MKVIFLDIDGVMNSHIFYQKRYQRRWIKPKTYWYLVKKYTKKLLGIKTKGVTLADYKIPNSHYTFKWQFKRVKDETCMEKWKWLSNWCNETGTKICISSVWRNHFGNSEYRSTPEKWEDAFQLLGFLPGTYVGVTGGREGCRGEEIQTWLNNHPDVEDYAILDDDSDMLDHQFNHFHHCDGWFGLTPNHLYRIERQFKGKTNYEKLVRIHKKHSQINN